MNEVVHQLTVKVANLMHAEIRASVTSDVAPLPENGFTENDLILLCREINQVLNPNEKVYLLLLLLDQHLLNDKISAHIAYLKTLCHGMGLEENLVERFYDFLTQDDPGEITQGEYLLLSPPGTSDEDGLEGRWIENHAPRLTTLRESLDLEKFRSHLLIMFVDQIRAYAVRCMAGQEQYFDQESETKCRFRLLEPGCVLSLHGVPVLTFSDVKSRFHRLGDRGQIHLWAEGVEYAGDKGKAGIRKFYASELTGQLIGIVGREGVGKSTLLKLLAGKIKPSSGSICINGYDLWRYKYMLKGIIGFVPEDDMLFEELTVSENLSLTARLFFNNLNSREIEMKVNAVLSKLDLLEAKHIVVGTTSGKQLQPGQRRLINIALEILREPQILLVDNALSGLGMSDAARVIRILHDYSFSGNLVITTISEVDNITFKLFDKLWVMDEGGRMVASGTAKEVSACLLERLNIKEQGWLATESSQLNDYLNYRMPETKGQVWTRVVSSEEWHDQYLKQQTTEKRERSMNMPLPARILKTPPLEIQLLIFSIRNFKCKFSNLYPIITTLLTGPLSALFLAFLMRPTSSSYSLFHNVNLPYYQFISVVISIFLGLVVSADEFIKERRIFEKEEYLELSRFSYLNSKILYLFPILGLQTLMYVITGNLVMGIREFVLAYWLVLFSASCFGILLGLLLSAHIMRRERTYKLILPLVIALQLLLGGGILKYEHLNTGIGQHVPVLGDLMVAKWGFEALAVKQFRDNKYERLFYKSQQREAVAAFHSLHTVPRLERALSVCKGSINNTDSMDYFCRMLQKELKSLTSTTDVFPFEYIQKLHKSDVINVNSDSPVSMSAEHRKLLQETEDYLMYLQLYFTSLAEEMKEQGISHLAHVRDSIGANQLELLKRNYHNAALEQLVTEKMAIYRAPESNLGRTNFFCATKLFNGQRADTFWFNISVIWSFSSVCYLLILFNVFGKRFYL